MTMDNRVLIVSVLLYMVIPGFLVLSVGQADAVPIIVSDFDDGTLQGWTPEPPFNASLFVEPSGGNPNGFMSVIDTAASGRLFARAPGLTGDLRALESIQWDEFVFDLSNTIKGTNIFIRGTDGTLYESDRSVLAVGVWINKFVQIDDPSSWTLVSGASSFEDVIMNADGFFINVGTTTTVGFQESGVDNIIISSAAIPEPTSLFLLGSGLIGLLGLRRK